MVSVGNLEATGSIYLDNGILQGTASYATTASYTISPAELAYTASFVSGTNVQGMVESASIAVLSMFARTASFVNEAISASYAVTASYVIGGSTVESSSYSNYSETSSYVNTLNQEVIISGGLVIENQIKPDFFLIKSSSFDALKITGSGLLVFGGYSFTPNALPGAMFYSASDEFFLGHNQ